MFAPRRLVASGAALTGLGWVLSAQVSGLIPLYLTYGVLCGIGTGIVYVGVVGLMARWFPDRRGFAIGIVAAGYGMGAMITTDTFGARHATTDPLQSLRGSARCSADRWPRRCARRPAAGRPSSCSPQPWMCLQRCWRCSS